MIKRIAIFNLTVGLGVCVVAILWFPEWYRSVNHLGFGQQLAAFVQSAWLPLVVLLLIWIERLRWHWRISHQTDHLRNYQALPSYRKGIMRYLDTLLAALPASIALVVIFDIGLFVALALALIVVGSAMWWVTTNSACTREAVQ